MSTSKLLDAVATVAVGATVAMPDGMPRGFTVDVLQSAFGTAANSATVLLQCSNFNPADNSSVWQTLNSFTLAGTGVASVAKYASVEPWKYLRGNVTALSSTGAVITMTINT